MSLIKCLDQMECINISSDNIDPNQYYNFELYLFMDQDRLYQKVRISLSQTQ